MQRYRNLAVILRPHEEHNNYFDWGSAGVAAAGAGGVVAGTSAGFSVSN